MRSSRRAQLIGLIAFLLLFPALGLLWIWNDGHTKVKRSAEAEAPQLIAEYCSGNSDRAKDVSTVRWRPRLTGGQDPVLKLGPAKHTAKFVAGRSWAGAIEEHIWQFVELDGRVEFASGEQAVRVRLARRTLHPEWMVDEIQVVR